MTSENNSNGGEQSLFGSIGRRNYLKSAAAAATAAGFGGSAGAQEDYETLTANGQTIDVGAGETFENYLIDLSTGDDFLIEVEGGNSVVRNIGFEGIYRGDQFMISITAPSGDVLIENVYLGHGATKEGSSHDHGPGGMFYHMDAGADVTFRYCNVQGYPNNAFYCSNSAYGGNITWEHCYAKNNGVSCFRGASAGDEIIDCVAYNDDTEPYFPGRTEDAGRPVWAWNPGPVTIENSDFHSGLGSNTYPYAVVAGANGDPSQIDYNSGDFAGDIQEASGSNIDVADQVGSDPDLTPPDGVPTSPEEAASGGGSGSENLMNLPPVLDGFERSSPVAEYGGSTNQFSVATSDVYAGSQAITNASGNFAGINSTSGLERYPERGDEIHYHFDVPGDDTFVAVNLFAQDEADNPDRYSVGLSGVDGEFKLWKNEGGTLTTLDSAAPAQQISGWYRAEVRTDSTTVYADLYDDSSDELLASVQAADSAFSSGGIGFRSAGNGEVFDYAIRSPIENGERSDPLSQYGGSTGQFSEETSTVYEGSRAITNASGDFGGINSTAGLPNYPSRGDEVHYRFNNAAADNFAAVNLFAQAEADNPDRYSVGLSGADGEFKLWKNEGGTLTTLDSAAPAQQISGWYRAEVRTDSTTVYADLYDDSSDELLASVQAADSAFSSGGIGFRSAGNGEVFDYVVR